MHIVYVTSELCGMKSVSKGGLASFVSNISYIMKEKGHSVEIILVTTKEDDQCYDLPVPVVNVFVPKVEWDEYYYVTQRFCVENNNDSDSLRKFIVDIRKAELVKQKLLEIDSKSKIDIVHFSNLGGYSLLMDHSIPYVVRISGFGNIIEEGEVFWQGN